MSSWGIRSSAGLRQQEGVLKGEGCSLLHIKAGCPKAEHGNMLGEGRKT